MAFRQYIAEEIAQDCADGLLSRREALRRLGMLGLGVAASGSLLAACGGDDDDEAETTDATTTSAPTATSAAAGAASAAETIRFAGPRGELIGAYAKPATAKGAVLVVHENRGLTPHFHSVVGRLAGDGYAALAVDLLSSKGGTASITDQAQVQAGLAEAPPEQLVADLRTGVGELQKRVPNAPIGAMGFCFGGGMVWRLIGSKDERIKAAIPFYGPAPDPADFTGSKAAVLGIYAEQDERVNATRERAEAALKAAGLTHEIKVFPGAQHAFFNDTNPERHNADAARQAYADVLQWFGTHLR